MSHIIPSLSSPSRPSHNSGKLHPGFRKHIFGSEHEAKVKADRNERSIYTLYTEKRSAGYDSDLATFLSYINYRMRVESMAPSTVVIDTSTLNIHAMASMDRAIEKAAVSLISPTPGQLFNPSLTRLYHSFRERDEKIAKQLHPPTQTRPFNEAEVDVILAKEGIISRLQREQIADKDLCRLKPGQWLNDEIINFYGQMIMARAEVFSEGHTKCSLSQPDNTIHRMQVINVHYFNTFFWTKLQTEGYVGARLAKWTKKFDIFTKDAVLIPINHNNCHWTCAAINFRKKRIESYDSMNLDATPVFKLLRFYLDQEHWNKRKGPFDFDGWKDYSPMDTPQQENGFDCGVFTCQFLESLSRGEESFRFSQRDMSDIRRRMIWEIGKAKFCEEIF